VGENNASVYQVFRRHEISFWIVRSDIPSVAAAKATMNSWTAYKGGVPNSVWSRTPATVQLGRPRQSSTADLFVRPSTWPSECMW
jgi:hypothetical protein